MEADSTTYDTSKKEVEQFLPFQTSPDNLKEYLNLITHSEEKCLEKVVIERLQSFGLLPKSLKCPSGQPDCQLVCKPYRVKDRLQWSCNGCGKRLPIRSGSFFLRLQCSLLQALQMILAWCEDADCTTAAEHFGVKPRVAALIFDKLDELAVKEQEKVVLGGENSVVLAEMYPDCLNRLSPDTTDQPHVHRMLMLADTNHIPTAYKIHVIRDDLKKQAISSSDSESLQAEVEGIVAAWTAAGSRVLAGAALPALRGADKVQDLLPHADADMQHFLTQRIWRYAVSVCSAARDLCAGAAACAVALQRYLHVAAYRYRYQDNFYQHTLRLIAHHYTTDCDVAPATVDGDSAVSV